MLAVTLEWVVLNFASFKNGQFVFVFGMSLYAYLSIYWSSTPIEPPGDIPVVQRSCPVPRAALSGFIKVGSYFASDECKLSLLSKHLLIWARGQQLLFQRALLRQSKLREFPRGFAYSFQHIVPTNV